MRKSISRSQLPLTSSARPGWLSCGRPDSTAHTALPRATAAERGGAPWNGLRRRRPLPSILFRAACSAGASASAWQGKRLRLPNADFAEELEKAAGAVESRRRGFAAQSAGVRSELRAPLSDVGDLSVAGRRRRKRRPADVRDRGDAAAVDLLCHWRVPSLCSLPYAGWRCSPKVH